MKKLNVTVIGMGYVGMPIAIEFAKKISVNGFDINESKIEQYKLGNDPTNEVGSDIIKESTVNFTSNPEVISNSSHIIVAVPTPINLDKSPDLTPIISASKLIGKYLKKDSIVIYESTVYPGVTEDICVPILEEISGMKCGVDFQIGYSPERINPGDKIHKLSNIKKVVAGGNKKATEEIAKLYEIVVKAGVVKVSDIKTAEATKVIENSQRDINIAFMNEVAMIFNEMNIDTLEVVEAMNTKWNALGFTPGLVGGHCIGVDPYYFIYEAEKLGYHSELISTGRRINDGLSTFVAENIIKELIMADKKVKGSNIVLFGLTFKENTPDSRNSKVADLISTLKNYGININVIDPLVNKTEAKNEYGIDIIDEPQTNFYDAAVIAVNHDVFSYLNIEYIDSLLKQGEQKVLIDIKGKFSQEELNNAHYKYWRL